MAQLRNSKHERFARFLAEGMSAVQAYEKAGYKPDCDAASRLQRKISICQRVRELLAERELIDVEATAVALNDAKVDRDPVVGRLAALAFTDITDVLEIKRGKVIVRDSAEWSPRARAAVAEVVQTKDGLRVKMADKHPALMALGRTLHIFDEAGVLTPRALDAVVQRILEVIERRAPDQVDDVLAELRQITASGPGSGAR